MKHKPFVVCTLPMLLTACANLAPRYEQPVAPVESQWPVSVDTKSDALEPASAANVTWAEFYSDVHLRQLIGTAMAQNRDLRVTALNIEVARAQYGITRQSQWPTVNAGASSTAQSVGGQIQREYSASLNISAFELDFFGRVRNLREQALETFLASEETLRAARISLVAEVATAYATLAADRQRLRLAEETFASQQKSFELTRRSYEIGVASALDVAQAQTSVDTARADIATYRTQVTQDSNALNLLVGQPIDPQLLPTAGSPADASLTLTQFKALDAGLPSELLLRRPDVLAAERNLRAANANIGVARAQMFPSITLTSGIGTASASLSNLFEGPSEVWSFVPSISMPIFDGGASRARVRVAKAQRESALATYEGTIQVAFREVADALAQRRDIGELIAARQSLVAATQKSYELSEARYRKGVDSYLVLLDAQRSLSAAQQNLITAQLVQTINWITLYRVLGGGWQVPSP